MVKSHNMKPQSDQHCPFPSKNIWHVLLHPTHRILSSVALTRMHRLTGRFTAGCATSEGKALHMLHGKPAPHAVYILPITWTLAALTHRPECPTTFAGLFVAAPGNLRHGMLIKQPIDTSDSKPLGQAQIKGSTWSRACRPQGPPQMYYWFTYDWQVGHILHRCHYTDTNKHYACKKHAPLHKAQDDTRGTKYYNTHTGIYR